MNPSSHCGTNIFVEELKFQYVRGHIHIHISTCHSKDHIDNFYQSGTLPGGVNMESFLTFGKEILFKLLTCMYCDSIGSFKDESCTIGYISQLNWNWRAHNRAGFFNGFELYLKLELFRSSYFGSKSWFCHSPCIGISIRFRGRNLHIFQSPTVKLKLEMWEIGFTVFLSVHEKITFKN